MSQYSIIAKVNGESFHLGVSADPAVLANWVRADYILTPAWTADRIFPLLTALLEALSRQPRRRWAGIVNRIVSLDSPYQALRRAVRRQGVGQSYPLRWQGGFRADYQLPEADDLDALLAIVGGRLLGRQQLIDRLARQGVWPAVSQNLLDWAAWQGKVQYLLAVEKTAWGQYRCNRCGSRRIELQPCPQCGRRQCPVCLSCATLGEMRGCQLLVGQEATGWNRPRVVNYKLAFSLTTAQQQAAQELLNFTKTSKRRALVWAACGAGKTEVVFPVLADYLSRGADVLFAVPRRDLVQELAERLAASFPQVQMAVHFGGQPWDQPGQLVVATTHQVLRFYHRFPLVILDEVDAFPYYGNPTLRFGLERAAARDGQIIEMTATPAGSLQDKFVITIPARHHGFPLPIPRVEKRRLPALDRADIEVPPEICRRLADKDSPWIVFVPTVKGVLAWSAALGRQLDREILSCHAGDPQRNEKRLRLKEPPWAVMVSTSVLERGITVPNVQVMVIHADSALYGERALIQMAGRVGRRSEYPAGEVWFIAERLTKDIKLAVKKIHRLNTLAAQRGLLVSPGEMGL